MVLRQHVEFHSSSDHKIQPCIHYMETLPSILHEMPWIQHEKHNVCIKFSRDEILLILIFDCLVILQLSDSVKLEGVQKICHQQAIVERGLKCVQLVYGEAGKCLNYKISKF